jgi:hypothetical protein
LGRQMSRLAENRANVVLPIKLANQIQKWIVRLTYRVGKLHHSQPTTRYAS